MASYFPPKINTAYILYVGLESVATAGAFQSTPTLASGDFKVSIDGGSLANLTTLPTVTPASGKMVKISLSSSEMNGDNITVVCSDASGGEWKDLIVSLQTAARQIDDLTYPTVSGRSTDVSTGGEVGIDWANIGSPTTAVSLSGTTVATVTTTTTATTATNVTTVNGLASGVITAASIATDAITAAKIADGAIDAATFAAGAINAAAIAADAITDAKVASDVTIASVTGAVGSVTGAVGSVTGNVGGSVASVTAGVTVTTNSDKTGYGLAAGAITAAVIATDAIDADAIATDAVTEIKSGLATQASLDTIDDFLDTEIAAIKAKTDNLPASPANEATLTTIAGYLDTEVAAIKAKTDNLPAAPAATGDIPSAASIATAVWGFVTASTYTAKEVLRLMVSVMTGKSSGGGTTTVVFRDIDDTKDRVVATVDADGNRTAVVRDPS